MFAQHPAGLRTLFFTEMWERFSYYGMRALLVLYLVDALQYQRADALAVYATYTALVYITPLIGGYLADRWLGRPRAVLIGALLMALGHFAMAVPALLELALGLLVAGNGFFKPNISTIVGTLYPPQDPRRDAGFTLFYMGINLGAFLTPLVCSTLGEKFGWHYGFAAAGVGMLLGLVVFVTGQKRLAASGVEGITALGRRDGLQALAITALVTVGVLLAVTLWPYVATFWAAAGWYLLAGGMLLVLYLVYGALESGRERHQVSAILIMALFQIIFWMGFEQAGGTMNLFAKDMTDRVLFGWEFPAGWFQSVNPLLIILLAPLFSSFWMWLDGSRFALSAPVKQGIGMIILGLGFVVMALAFEQAQAGVRVSPLWLLVVYLLHTMGELCLSPIGLSMVTRLSPVRFGSLMMGLWFIAIAVANYLAGTLEALLAGSGIGLFWFLVLIPMGAGLVLIVISPLLHRLMHEVR